MNQCKGGFCPRTTTTKRGSTNHGETKRKIVPKLSRWSEVVLAVCFFTHNNGERDVPCLFRVSQCSYSLMDSEWLWRWVRCFHSPTVKLEVWRQWRCGDSGGVVEPNLTVTLGIVNQTVQFLLKIQTKRAIFVK